MLAFYGATGGPYQRKRKCEVDLLDVLVVAVAPLDASEEHRKDCADVLGGLDGGGGERLEHLFFILKELVQAAQKQIFVSGLKVVSYFKFSLGRLGVAWIDAIFAEPTLYKLLPIEILG